MAEIIGSAAIEIKAKDRNFEKEVRRIASQIKKVEVPVDAVVNTDMAKKQLEVFRKSQQSRRIKLYVDVDTRKAATTLNKFIKSYQDKDVKIGVDVDTQQVFDAANLIDDFTEQYDGKRVDLGVDVDDSTAKQGLDDIRRTADSVSSSINNDFSLDVDTARANSQLIATAALAQVTRRAITSPMRMGLDKQTIDGLKGFFYTLTGGIPIDKVRSALLGLSANFEGIAVKSGMASSGVLSLVGSLSHVVGDLMVIGGDITQAFGLFNAAPAALAAGGLAITGTLLGWKGFGTALMGEGKEAAEALKLLPPEAQKAVKSLDGLGGTIRVATQTSYWKNMGTAVQDVVKVVRSDLVAGMSDVGGALGGQLAAVLGSVQEFGESGGLRNTFSSLTDFFENSTPALAGLTSGFLDLMEGGARNMPAFGTWLSEIGTNFSEWAKEANESGAINNWISQGAQRMAELGKVTQATYGILSGITSAARDAGMNGLTDLTEGMVNLSNTMNTQEFQEGLSSFFSSVRIGAANAFPGMGNFFNMMGKGLPTINKSLEVSGTIAGNMFDNFTRMFENRNMGKGFLELLSGMEDGTQSLAPGFEHLGNALGGLMEIAGEVIRNVAPGLNQLFETIDIVVNNMKEGIIDAMPVFNEFIQGLLAGVRMVVGPLASLAGTMLSLFADLPGPIQTAMMSLGGFLGASALIRNRMGMANSAIGNFATNTQNRMRTLATRVSDSVAVMSRAYGSFNPSRSSAFIGPQTLAQTNSNLQKIVNSNRSAAERIQGIWARSDLRREQIAIRSQTDRAVSRIEAQQRVQGIGGQILPLTGRNAFNDVVVSAKNASSRAAESLKTIGRTAGVVGGQITRGIGAAMGGLMGAMGGPWGLAVAGMIGGLALIGQAAADNKNQIEEYFNLIQEEGGKIGPRLKKAMSADLYEDTGSLVTKFLSLNDGFNFDSSNIGKTLDQTGIKANSLVNALVEGGEDSYKVWKQFADNNKFVRNFDGMAASAQLTDEQLRKLGISSREALEGMSAEQLDSLSHGLLDIANKAGTAEQKASALGQTFRELAADQIDANRIALESQNSSLEEKLTAFKSNLQLGGLEQLTNQAGFYQLGQVTDQNNQKLKTLSDTLKQTGKSLQSSVNVEGILGNNVAMFEMNSQAGRQMYEVVSTQADAVHSAMMSSYDSVLKRTGDLGQAQESALKTAREGASAFRTELENVGFDPSTIESIIDTAGLSDLDIELALKTKGIDEAISQAMAVEAAMQGLRTSDWTMTIDVMADEAQDTIARTLGLAEEATSGEIVQNIRAYFENNDEYQSWMVEFGKSIPEQQARMVAELVNGDEAKSAIDAISSTGEKLDGQVWRTAINVAAEEAEASANQIYTAINNIPPETLATITTDVQGDPTAELKAVLASEQFRAEVEAVLEQGDLTSEIQASVPKKTTFPITGEVQDGFKNQVESAVGSVNAQVPIELKPPTSNLQTLMGGASAPSVKVDATLDPTQVNGQLNSIQDKNISVNVSVSDEGLQTIKTALESISDKSVSVTVSATESNLNTVKDTIDQLSDKAVSVSVSAHETNLGHIKSQIDQLNDKTVSVSVNASENNLGHVANQISSLSDKSVSVSVSADPGPVNALSAGISSISGKTVSVIAEASSAQVIALRDAINSIAGKAVAVIALAPTLPVLMLKAAIDSVESKTVAVLALTNTSAVLGLRNAIASIRSKTVTVTAITSGITTAANGGIIPPVRTFARGGFDDPRIAKAIERANRRGGSENHTAQIARGSNNYRVWAEPETGGEAYIPLAMSKRLRSLKILEQVAQHFGMTLESFSDGGLLSGNKVSSNVTTFASGGTTRSTRSAKAKEDAKKRADDLKQLNQTIKDTVKDLKDALTSGLSDLRTAFGKAEQSPVQKALDGVRQSVREFKTETNNQIKEAKKLGKNTSAMTRQLKATTKVDKDISRNMYSTNVWKRAGGNLQNSRNIAGDARRRQSDSRVDYNTAYSLRDYELAINNVNKELEKQRERYDKMVQNHTSNMESISSSLFRQFDIGSLVKSKDEFGYRPPTTAREISSYASKMLADMKKFSSNLNALRKAGYNEAIINQISQMGLEEGLVVSQALLTDKSQLSSINNSFTQMFGKAGDMNIASDGSTYIGGLARTIGKNGADSMFKAGNDVQKGLVNGLTADLKALEKAGQTLSDALINSFKKALQIKSPSRVFEKLGRFIPQGLISGIDRERSAVGYSISNLVQPRRLNLTNPSSQPNRNSGIINGNTGGSPIEVNVYPSAGMSEQQIGTTAAREIYYRLDT